ncbi:MAG: hypothetical protein U0234_08935 [Sandaracinus sp.]
MRARKLQAPVHAAARFSSGSLLLAAALGAGCSTAIAGGEHDAGHEDARAFDLDGGAPDAARVDASMADAATTPDGGMRCPVTLPSPLVFGLDHGAFPSDGHPDVAVHVPAGYDACAPQGAVVYFHGFHNCVENAIGSTPTECTPGAGARTAHHLVEQLDAAHVNAMLIAVEVAYDQASGATGRLSEDGGLRALLDELFDAHLSAMLGRPTTIDDLDTIVLASHSGGYTAVARGLDRGQLPSVREVMLFDSLYGEIPVYEAFTVDQLARFDPAGADALRFAIVYTDGGGTDANSRALAGEIESGLDTLGHPEWMLFDDTTATLDASAFAHPIVIKHSMLSHDGVVTYYFERFVSAAPFAPLP